MGRTPVPGDGPDLRLPSERALYEPYGDVALALQPAAGQFDEAVFQVVAGSGLQSAAAGAVQEVSAAAAASPLI